MGDPRQRRRRCGHHRRHRSAGRADHRALRSDYLTIVTLGFSESVRIAATNGIWLTNGSDGIPGPWRGIVSPQVFEQRFLGIVLAVLAVTFVLLQRLSRAPFGRVLRAIRDDEDVAGKHVLAFKVQAAVAQLDGGAGTKRRASAHAACGRR